jgi:hypothetical protein
MENEELDCLDDMKKIESSQVEELAGKVKTYFNSLVMNGENTNMMPSNLIKKLTLDFQQAMLSSLLDSFTFFSADTEEED